MTPITTSTCYVEHQVYVSMTMSKASTKVNTTKVTHREHRCKKETQLMNIIHLYCPSTADLNIPLTLG